MAQTELQLPQAVRLFFELTNRGDADGVVACFTPDAILRDGGRTFEGRDGVASWDRTDNTGVQSRITASSVTYSGNRLSVAVRVTGGGFNGTGQMQFVLAGDQIASLEID